MDTDRHTAVPQGKAAIAGQGQRPGARSPSASEGTGPAGLSVLDSSLQDAEPMNFCW